MDEKKITYFFLLIIHSTAMLCGDTPHFMFDISGRFMYFSISNSKYTAQVLLIYWDSQENINISHATERPNLNHEIYRVWRKNAMMMVISVDKKKNTTF